VEEIDLIDAVNLVTENWVIKLVVHQYH